MSDSARRRSVRNVAVFSAIVLASGWLGVALDRFAGGGHAPGQSPGMAVWLCLPLLTAVMLRSLAGDGWSDAALRPRLGHSWRWYLISLVVFPAVSAVSLLVGALIGGVSLSSFEASDYVVVAAAGLVPQVVKNVFEEFAWRSYLTSRLVTLGSRDAVIYLVVGLVWALWHLPYYLVFLPEADISNVLPASRPVIAVLCVVVIMGWTIMYTEIYRACRSLWPLVLAHAAEDAVMNPLLLHGFVRVLPGWELLFSPVVGVVPLSLYVALGLWLRRRRLRADQ